MSVNSKRAAIYARISSDPTGSLLGVTDQICDCRELAGRRDVGWTVVGEPYVENDTSAFRKRRVVIDGQVRYRVVRPVFADLLRAARAGAFDAILVHDLDRMARDPRDLEDLIELVEHHGIEIRSVTGSLNLTAAHDVTMARVLVAMANKSSHDTARRVSRSARRNAEAGKARGRRCFGYLGDGTLVPAEADAIRTAADSVIAGASLHEVCRRWDAAGLRRLHGGTWRPHPNKAKEVLVSARIAGIPVHQGSELRGVRAAWEPIITVEQLDRVRAILLDPRRRTNGTRPPRNSALSGLIRCECGSVMRSSTQPYSGSGSSVTRVGAFRCASAETSQKCYSTVRAAPVEEAVLEAVVREALECDLEAFADDPADGARLTELAAVLAEVETGRADVALLVAQRALTASSAAPALSALADQERAAQAEWEAISRRVAPAQLLRSVATDLLDLDDAGADARAATIASRFVELDLSVQRKIIGTFLQVTIRKGLRARPGDRVEVRSVRTGAVIDMCWNARLD